jgi:putative endonuclease
MTHIELGIYGEKLAEKHLLDANYKILNKNYRFKKLELDLVALKDNKLIVVEVKTRFTDEYGEPWQSVTRKKQKQIIKATNQYILENDIQNETQFDIISIIKNEQFEKIEHIQDAFCP